MIVRASLLCTLLTVCTSGPGRGGELVVFEAGERVCGQVKVVLPPVVSSPGTAVVGDRFSVIWRVGWVPGQGQIVLLRGSRGVAVTRGVNTLFPWYSGNHLHLAAIYSHSHGWGMSSVVHVLLARHVTGCKG